METCDWQKSLQNDLKFLFGMQANLWKLSLFVLKQKIERPVYLTTAYFVSIYYGTNVIETKEPEISSNLYPDRSFFLENSKHISYFSISLLHCFLNTVTFVHRCFVSFEFFPLHSSF